MENQDRLGIAKNKNIIDQFQLGEYILVSALVTKINQDNKKQQRILLITNKYLYNIIPEESNKIVQFFKNIVTSQKIKRKIPIITIYGVTYSNIGSEFVIHVPTAYDYRFHSVDQRRQDILIGLISVYMKVNMKKMVFFFKDDFTLVTYTTTENDMKKSINRMPLEAPVLLDTEDFKSRVSNKVVSEQVYSKGINNLTKLSIGDFDLIKVLGRGAFGKVMLCEKKDSQELFAIKSLRKEQIMDKNQVEHTRTERKLLEQINNAFLVSLEYAFQTEEKLFFVMKFMRGGELFHHLRQARKFPEATAKFYAASIIYAMEYLHKIHAVYRDIKPENILMDENGYVQVTDFGLAKFIEGTSTNSFVGTPEYLAPEIIGQHGHGFDVDWWSLGILIYEMLVGRPPFSHKNQDQLFRMIQENEVQFPSQMQFSSDVKNLIQLLLKKNPNERLGHKGDGEEIRQHNWFNNFNFNDLLNKKMVAPIVPKLLDKFDVKNFDDEFTREEAINSVVDSDKKMLKQFSEDFGGVTYAPKRMGE